MDQNYKGTACALTKDECTEREFTFHTCTCRLHVHACRGVSAGLRRKGHGRTSVYGHVNGIWAWACAMCLDMSPGMCLDMCLEMGLDMWPEMHGVGRRYRAVSVGRREEVAPDR